MIAFLAFPIQSQTPVPTAPAQLTNPTVMAPCGLPASWAQFNASATVTTFNMTADCVFNSWSVQSSQTLLLFVGGTFIINGNGHSIISNTGAGWILYISNAGTVLNLNDVTIRQNGGTRPVVATGGARLNARSVIFRDNTTSHSTLLISGSEAHLEDVQFLNNRVTTAAPIVSFSGANSLTVLTNGIFRRNVVNNSDILTVSNFGAARIEGCIISENNFQTDGVTPANSFRSADSTGTLTDNRDNSSCPRPKRKKKEVPTATPTATPRPAYGASYTALQTATGMTFEATYGLDSGVHFRQLDGAGIGIQSIIDAGYLAALDVYGYVEQGVEVCFPQIGRVIFLDARTMPRAITPLESTVVNGMTCVSISSPGSLVLMPN